MIACVLMARNQGIGGGGGGGTGTDNLCLGLMTTEFILQTLKIGVKCGLASFPLL